MMGCINHHAKGIEIPLVIGDLDYFFCRSLPSDQTYPYSIFCLLDGYLYLVDSRVTSA